MVKREPERASERGEGGSTREKRRGAIVPLRKRKGINTKRGNVLFCALTLIRRYYCSKMAKGKRLKKRKKKIHA